MSRYLSERLVGMLADPVEKCREMAGGASLSFVVVVLSLSWWGGDSGRFGLLQPGVVRRYDKRTAEILTFARFHAFQMGGGGKGGVERRE